MDAVKTLENNLKNLKEQVEDLERFQTTYNITIPEVKKLLHELFEKDSIKSLKTYDILRREYLDRIIAMFNPKNFTQLVIETSLPDVYDPPSIRNKKITAIRKITKELQAQKEKSKSTKDIPKIPKKAVTTKNLKDTPYPDFDFNDFKKTPETPTLIKDSAIQTIKLQKTPPLEHFSTNDLEFKRKLSGSQKQDSELKTRKLRESQKQVSQKQDSDSGQSTISCTIKDLEEPELMLLKIDDVSYCYDPDSLKIYDILRDKNREGMAVLVGEIKDGSIIINEKHHKLPVENVYKFFDQETEETFYQSCKKTTSFYQKLTETDGWLIGLEDEQSSRLVPCE